MRYELKTALKYKIRYFDASDEEPEITVGVLPDFDGYNREGDECIVFDFLALAEEMDSNVNYYPITCECGMSDDAGIYAPLTQTVTETEVYWDIPIADYRWTISPEYKDSEGVLRLIFNKQQFQQTILKMNTELRSFVENGIEIATIKPEDFIKLYGAKYHMELAVANNPQITHARVWQLPPYEGIDVAKLFVD